MMKPFRTFGRLLLPVLLLAAGPAVAQLGTVGPLPADPGRARYLPTTAQLAQAQRTTALALPFFDDFTRPLEGAPSLLRWTAKGGALVSNRLALLPLTRGVATLDGLRANGQPYSAQTTSFYGAIDSLESQPINLGGLTTSDQVFLSFAWQAGGITGPPRSNAGSTPVRLELWLKTTTATWVRAWSYNSLGVRTSFRQQVIDLNQPQYLHGQFQFRFIAYGISSENRDTWGLDYVKLDRGRTAGLADTVFVDVAASAGLLGGNLSGGAAKPLEALYIHAGVAVQRRQSVRQRAKPQPGGKPHQPAATATALGQCARLRARPRHGNRAGQLAAGPDYYSFHAQS